MDRAVAPRPAVIELIGPAGVGKSTIRKGLTARTGLTGQGLWKLPARLLVPGAIRVLPSCVELWRAAGMVPWQETKQVIRLEALFRLLRGANGRGRRTWLLDEGPVFALTWLRTVGRDPAHPSRFAGWWRHAIARWRETIDAIVWLDAPSDVLAERIRTRAKDHEVKTWSDADAVRFLDGFRAAFADTVADLTSGNGVAPEVLRIDTHGSSADAIVDDLLQRLDGRLDAR